MRVCFNNISGYYLAPSTRGRNRAAPGLIGVHTMTTLSYKGIEIHVNRFGKIFWMSQWDKLPALKDAGIIFIDALSVISLNDLNRRIFRIKYCVYIH